MAWPSACDRLCRGLRPNRVCSSQAKLWKRLRRFGYSSLAAETYPLGCTQVPDVTDGSPVTEEALFGPASLWLHDFRSSHFAALDRRNRWRRRFTSDRCREGIHVLRSHVVHSAVHLPNASGCGGDLAAGQSPDEPGPPLIGVSLAVALWLLSLAPFIMVDRWLSRSSRVSHARTKSSPGSGVP